MPKSLPSNLLITLLSIPSRRNTSSLNKSGKLLNTNCNASSSLFSKALPNSSCKSTTKTSSINYFSSSANTNSSPTFPIPSTKRPSKKTSSSKSNSSNSKSPSFISPIITPHPALQTKIQKPTPIPSPPQSKKSIPPAPSPKTFTSRPNSWRKTAFLTGAIKS